MIEISHAQARFLIRQSLDARAGDGRRLPDEQWMALQAHLENCSECQAYNRQVMGVEKGLRQVLASRWQHISGAEGGPGGLDGIVGERTTRRERRERLLGWARRVGMAALVVLAAAALLNWNRERRMEAAVTPVATATQAAPPTAAPAAFFDGIVLYAGREAGAASGTGEDESNSEIFVLQSHGSRVETSNLTQNPAQDTHPVWSPDGEWIAFLSDRNGKPEVYAMTVAGSRVTRLTGEPGIAWEGPLAWSPDGQWIALPGKRLKQGNVSWLYLVSMDRNTAAHPLAVPGSRGVDSRARFVEGPDGDVNLVFQQPADLRLPAPGSIVSVRILTGEQNNLTARTASPFSMLPSGGFDIGGEPDSIRLVYLGNTVDNAFVRGAYIASTQRESRFEIDRAPFGSLQDVILIPADWTVAYLRKDPDSSCWKINLRPVDLRHDMRVVEGLCVDGGLAPGQWASTGGWGVVVGQADGDDDVLQLWAVLLPQAGERDSGTVYYPLGNAQDIAGDPQLRPNASRLEIIPQAAVAPPVLPAESELPDPLPRGKVVFSVPEGLNSRIEMMDPDVTNRRVILEANDFKSCPALSPDGTRLAYLSNRSRAYPYLSSVYIHDLSNSAEPDRRLSLPNLDYAGYECPAWSPDGKALAMVGHLFGLSYLAIFSVETAVDADGTPSPETLPTGAPEDGLLETAVKETAVKETGVYLTIDTPSAGLQPVWTPDSRSVYLGFPRRMGFPPVVNLYHWNGPDRDISSPGAVLTFSAGWEDILGLSISPDGRRVALLAERSLVPSGETTQSAYGVLQIYERSTMKILNDWELSSYDPGIVSTRWRLFWQADGQVVFSYPADRFFSRAVSFIRFNPFLDTLQLRATSPDILHDWTLMGDWLLFASESGLWGVTISPGLESPSLSPRWLSGDVVEDLASIGQ